MTRVLLVLFIALSWGCSQQAEDFVKGAKPVSIDMPSTPGPDPLMGSGKMGIKLSPGGVRATGTAMGAEMNLTDSKYSMKSTSMGAQVGVSQDSLVH